MAITSISKTVIERREYEPYGYQTTPTLQDGPNYTGHVADAATGLIYMQQRYCDPMIGRCLSVDPVTAYDSGDMRFFNRYAYAFNNPFTFKDPFGREPCDGDDCPPQEVKEHVIEEYISDGSPGPQPDSVGDAIRQNIKNDISEMVDEAQESVQQCAAAAASCAVTEIVGEDAVDAYVKVNTTAVEKGAVRGAELYGTVGARVFLGRIIAVKNIYDAGSIAVCTVQACTSEDDGE